MTEEGQSPADRAAALLKRLHDATPESVEPVVPATAFDADLIPEVESNYEQTPTDDAIDRVVDGISILDAYRVFIGKMEPTVGSKREGIKISCPNPTHPDTDPSAWVNLDSDTWYCGGCAIGGDIFDLAAIHFGYQWPDGYKGDDFPALRRQMAEAFGLVVVHGVSGDIAVAPDEVAAPAPELTPAPELPSAVPQPAVAPTVPLSEVLKNEDFVFSDPTVVNNEDLLIDWERIVPKDSFLDIYMRAVTIDDLPHEYHFWLAMQALGFAANRNVKLRDFKNVLPGIFVCTYGPTGSGKSRALAPYERLLKAALPYDHADPQQAPTGVQVLPAPQSAEALIDSFKCDLVDGSMQPTNKQGSVTGLLKVEEFASFVAKSSRVGSSMKETLIEMFDASGEGDMSLHSRGSGITKIAAPFCQMVTTTQPKAIHSYLRRTDTESGFLNRWIVAAGRPRVRPISYGGSQVDIDAAVASLQRVHTWVTQTTISGPLQYTLEGEALEVWDEFFHKHIADMKTGEIEVESMHSRIDLMIKKIIILFSINEMVPNPAADIVRKAIELYEYLKLTYSMFSTDIAYSDNAECQGRIVQIIEVFEAKGGGATRREIIRRVGKKFDLDTIGRALKILVDLQVVIEDVKKQSGRGRPTTQYTLGK